MASPALSAEVTAWLKASAPPTFSKAASLWRADSTKASSIRSPAFSASATVPFMAPWSPERISRSQPEKSGTIRTDALPRSATAASLRQQGYRVTWR
jgi:hypothetical protein